MKCDEPTASIITTLTRIVKAYIKELCKKIALAKNERQQQSRVALDAVSGFSRGRELRVCRTARVAIAGNMIHLCPRKSIMGDLRIARAHENPFY